MSNEEFIQEIALLRQQLAKQNTVLEEQKNAISYFEETLSQREEIISQLDQNISELEGTVSQLDEQVKLLKNVLYARKTEKKNAVKANDYQLSLFDEIETPVIEELEQKQVEKEEKLLIPAHTRSKKGRRPLPEDLPREVILHDIPEEEKICACGCHLKKIGEEISEKLEFIPATIVVKQHIRPKYACPNCEGSEDEGKTVKIACMPPQIVDKGIATPSLLTFIAVNKFVGALPLYRQNKIFERLGIDISRSNMSRWMIAAANACKPLVDLLYENLRQGEIINMDETTVQVLCEKERSNTTKSYMWVSCGGRDGPVRLFHYAPSRSRDIAKFLLGDFAGFLQTDGYQGYEKLEDNNSPKQGITHVGCLAHVRRKFVEANACNKKKSGLATWVLDEISKIYRLEKQLRESTKTSEEILSSRAEKIRPICDKIYAHLQEAQPRLVPSLLLGKAVHYALGQWERVIEYLQHPDLTPDNNIAENAIRPFVIGRKNWLFSGSPKGAESSAILYSLIETAKANELNPEQYLLHIFENIPYAKSKEEQQKLLPWEYKQTLKNKN